jgi:hypothetical protein
VVLVQVIGEHENKAAASQTWPSACLFLPMLWPPTKPISVTSETYVSEIGRAAMSRGNRSRSNCKGFT